MYTEQSWDAPAAPALGASRLPTAAAARPMSRFTPMDFELYISRGRDPTDEMRRSNEYYYWYHNKVPLDPRAPPPLPSRKVQDELNMETAWDDDDLAGAIGGTGGTGLSMQQRFQQAQAAGRASAGAAPAAAAGGRRKAPGLSLDADDIQETQQMSIDPYGAKLVGSTVLSPTTQYFAAYAPSPLAGASPDTLRAYAHGANLGAVQPPASLRASKPVASQQYYTQEPFYAQLPPASLYDPGVLYVDPTVGDMLAGGSGGLPHGHPQQQQPLQRGQQQQLMPWQQPIPQHRTAAMNNNNNNSNNSGTGRNNNSNNNNNSGGRGRGRGEGRGRGRGRFDPRLLGGSEKLQQFRAAVANKTVGSWSLRDVCGGYALEFAKDQEGSRFIQSAVDTASPAEVEEMMREIFVSPVELVTDVFGNYVLQKLLTKGTPEQLTFAAEHLRGHIVELTLQTYGCRVIQKCIEVMPDAGIDIILGELQGNVARCIQDQNGNHVVQKCVEVIPQRCEFIVSAFTGKVLELATHAYGCRVIQCILEHCPDHQEAIFSELLRWVHPLATDQYGNYVIQHILEHDTTGERVAALYDALEDNFYNFSKQKYASNVMEKLFYYSTPELRMRLVEHLSEEYPAARAPNVEVVDFVRSTTTTAADLNAQAQAQAQAAANGGGNSNNNNAPRNPHENAKERYKDQKDAALGIIESVEPVGFRPPSMLCLMLNDQYANYVVQRILDASDVEQFVVLANNIQRYILPIRTYTYGRPIVLRLSRRHLVKHPSDDADGGAATAAMQAELDNVTAAAVAQHQQGSKNSNGNSNKNNSRGGNKKSNSDQQR